MIRINEIHKFTNLLLRSRSRGTRIPPFSCRPTPSGIICRHIAVKPSSSRLSFDNNKILQYYHAKDGIPMRDYTLIYRCTFPNYLLISQIVNFVILFTLSSVTLYKSMEINAPEIIIEEEEKVLEEKRRKLEELQNIEKIGDGEVTSWRNLFGLRKWWREFDFQAEKESIDRARQLQDGDLPRPSFDEMFEGGLESLLFLSCLLIFFMAATTRMQRTLPIRIYTSPSGHSISIFLGHLIPGRVTTKEFIAGHLKNAYNPKGILWSNSVYKDGAGNRMILFEQMFRYPADLNRLMGIRQQSFEDYSTEKDDEASQSNK